MYMGCIFVDFSKDFKTINHSILIDKLSLYGFRPNSLKLVTTRTQITKVNDCISSARRVKCGTAQGSILGPLIYILYVNDVLKTLDNVNDIYSYADDMLIMSSNLNVENMMISFQSKMNKIHDWCIMNRLTINESKTKYMIVANNHVETIGSINIAGKRGFHGPTKKGRLVELRKKNWSVPQICIVGHIILLVFPLYCGHRLVTDRPIEIVIFGWSQRLVWPTN